MKKLKIYKDTNPLLREKCLPVDIPLLKEDKDLLYSMLEYLHLSTDEQYAKKHNMRPGVGLAAPQVGVKKRMFVISYYENEHLIEYAFVNPKITERSAKKAALEFGEGCLSVDTNHEGIVHRDYKITISGFDLLQNKEITLKTCGYLAIVIQHEYDHLDGILFYDRIDPFNKNTFRFGEVKI